MANEAATRLISRTIVNAGIVGAGIFRSPAHPVTGRAGQILRSSATISATDTAETVPLQATPSISDDWDFAEMEGSEPLARQVFGPPPSSEEAESATRELSFFLQNASETSDDSSLAGDVIPSSETGLVARKAFAFIHRNPAAQSVVSSIMCDPNVYEAVARNAALMEYINAGRSAYAKSEGPIGNNSFVEEENGESANIFKGFIEFINVGEDNNRSGPLSANDIVATFMGLAVMAIVVVVFKRIR